MPAPLARQEAQAASWPVAATDDALMHFDHSPDVSGISDAGAFARSTGKPRKFHSPSLMDFLLENPTDFGAPAAFNDDIFSRC
ncbi:hypothetical protein [Noviherbaspirillum autotrophicum]|uniref:hypothetical protein n=1 Tax=Noviherbaspirillum autotrophicum TaxID=709839 RepID=UPI0012FD8D8A|nr:hypothetical protein [Noviherbaspirillum autotrophicum]